MLLCGALILFLDACKVFAVTSLSDGDLAITSCEINLFNPMTVPLLHIRSMVL